MAVVADGTAISRFYTGDLNPWRTYTTKCLTAKGLETLRDL